MISRMSCVFREIEREYALGERGERDDGAGNVHVLGLADRRGVQRLAANRTTIQGFAHADSVPISVTWNVRSPSET